MADRAPNPLSHEFGSVPLVANTGVQYKDPADPRFELALATAEGWRDADVPFVVVDSSPEEWPAAALRERGAVVLKATVGGIASQRQQAAAFSLASGAKTLVSAEPEKTLMPRFVPEITAGLLGNSALSIGRTPEAMRSLPPVQRRTETLGGWVFEQLLGLPADQWSGGRAFTDVGAYNLEHYPFEKPGMNNWIWLYKTMLDSRAEGLPVGGITIDLQHPASMVEEETGNRVFDMKRYAQFALQVRWAAAQPQVAENPRAQEISDLLIRGLDILPTEPTKEQYEVYFKVMEDQLAPYGYLTPEMLDKAALLDASRS